MTSPLDGPRLVEEPGEKDHVAGPAGAPATLVEYGDYQCPYCAKAQVAVKALRAEMGDRLRYAFRHFPLAKVHPLAKQAAEAAEAAGAQGKFWDMHDWMLEHGNELELDHLLARAKELGLDVARFKQDVTGHRYAAKVQEDLTGGVRSGVKGTPTFFVNGARYGGAFETDKLRAALGA